VFEAVLIVGILQAEVWRRNFAGGMLKTRTA